MNLQFTLEFIVLHLSEDLVIHVHMAHHWQVRVYPLCGSAPLIQRVQPRLGVAFVLLHLLAKLADGVLLLLLNDVCIRFFLRLDVLDRG